MITWEGEPIRTLVCEGGCAFAGKGDASYGAGTSRRGEELQRLRRQALILPDQTGTDHSLGHLKEATVKCQQALELTVHLMERQKGSSTPIGNGLNILRSRRELGLPDITLPAQGPT